MKTDFQARVLVEVTVPVSCGRIFGVQHSLDEVLKEKFGTYNRFTLLETWEDEDSER